MTPESLDLARAWMAKANSDLETAVLLVRDQRRLLDIAVYHCQQCAEKALKGWLTANEVIFPKTHSLEDILALCVPLDSSFARFGASCEQLTPYADLI